MLIKHKQSYLEYLIMELKRRIKSKLLDCQHIILNYFVANIPFWTIRRFFYRLFGMKIGKKSRILMKCFVQAPNQIEIGEGTVINEFCYLDGRGGLSIGKNVNISIYSMIITASHDRKSASFAYRTDNVEIGDNVWLGSRAIVLDGSRILDRAIIGAGCVFKGTAHEDTIYVGNPAIEIGNRELQGVYSQDYRPWFR